LSKVGWHISLQNIVRSKPFLVSSLLT